MTSERRLLGRRGELPAEAQLRASGCRIVERNYRCAEGEMDVVTTRDAVWVFVQVRTRRGSRCGRPEESIDQAKADRLIRIGQSYLQDHAIEGVDWRVDLVAVEMDATGRLLRVEQLESAVGGW